MERIGNDSGPLSAGRASGKRGIGMENRLSGGGLLLALALPLLLLTACQPVYKTGYNLTPPASAEGRFCVSQCQNSKLLCEQAGRSDRDACLAKEQADAERRFADYRVERTKKGKKIEKQLSDFDYSYRCGYSDARYTKTCEPDFVACFANCGGTVVPYTYCSAFCN